MREAWALAAICAGIVAGASGQEIHLKTRTFSPVAGGRVAVASGRTIHQIVEFSHPVGVNDLEALNVAGARVTGVLPDNAVVVSTAGGLSTMPDGAVWLGPLDGQDKVSPVLTNVSGIPVMVELHSDVDAAQQSALETELGVVFIRPSGLMPQHAIVLADVGAIASLASDDRVAYIFPADPELLTGAYAYPCAGMLTMAGPVPQYSNITHGWSLDSDNAAHLSYSFSSLTTNVPAATVQSEILRAMAQWAKIVNVTFMPTTAASVARSITIEFASGAHGDGYPFEGAGVMLAHTFYPAPINGESIAGDMHFNADEAWAAGSDIDIYTVALHEIGHALGLSHSDNPGDVMYPYYQRGMPLSANDIGAALELYPAAGAPPSPVTVTTSASTPAALALTIDPFGSTTQTAVFGLSGTVTGGNGGDSIAWRTDHGYSGSGALSASGNWTMTDIPLVTGTNMLTVTAFDATDQVATKIATVTLQPEGTAPASPSSSSSPAPVTLVIHSPVSPVVTVVTSTITVSGKASGGAGITEVTWQTSNGAGGTASGTGTWVATGIPVPEGNTTIILRAYDSKGSSAWVALVAVRP